MKSDCLRFLRYNLQHYAHALWGIELRFDPPFPIVTRFLPKLISEPVLEYRTYGVMIFWALLLAWGLPLPVLGALVAGWACISWDRSRYLKSGVVFWRRVVRENGLGAHRGHGRLMEALILEIERQMKQHGEWDSLAVEALRLQDDVITDNRKKAAPGGILGPKIGV